jgi:hypothetical protein
MQDRGFYVLPPTYRVWQSGNMAFVGFHFEDKTYIRIMPLSRGEAMIEGMPLPINSLYLRSAKNQFPETFLVGNSHRRLTFLPLDMDMFRTLLDIYQVPSRIVTVVSNLMLNVLMRKS